MKRIAWNLSPSMSGEFDFVIKLTFLRLNGDKICLMDCYSKRFYESGITNAIRRAKKELIKEMREHLSMKREFARIQREHGM